MDSLEPPRKRRRGGKIYSGCATCRTRKIKCDGRQPICLNCERSRRYVCDGQSNHSASRGNRAEHRYQVDKTRAWGQADDAQLQLNSHGDSRDPVLPSTAPYVEADQGPSLIFDNDHGFFNRALPWQTELGALDLDLQLFQAAADAFTMPGIDFPFPATSRIPTPQPSLNVAPGSSSFGLPAAPEPRSMDALLHHWRTHICPLMMPTSAPSKNPYLHIFLPMALSDPPSRPKRCLLLAMLAAAAFNRAELSLDDKTDLQRQAREFKDQAGSMLKELTMDDDPATFVDEVDRKSSLAAALTMTTIEVFSGEDKGTAYENLLLAKQVIQLTGGVAWWLADESRSTLLQIFRCHEILAHTSGWRWFEATSPPQGEDTICTEIERLNAISDEAARLDQDPWVNMSTLGKEYTLDVSFGVAKQSLKCLNLIIEMSATKTAMTEPQTWSPMNADALRELENEVFDALRDQDSLSSPREAEAMYQEGMSSYVSEELTQNHILAFHHAVAIFFKRALCDGGASVKPTPPPPPSSSSSSSTTDIPSPRRPTGQELVSTTLEHLENIDALAGDTIVANTLWPAFIAAAEAVDTPLRHRALIWFARAKRHGIGNIAKAKQLVMEVWRRVDRQAWVSPERRNLSCELGHVDWRRVMEEKGMYIMLT